MSPLLLAAAVFVWRVSGSWPVLGVWRWKVEGGGGVAVGLVWVFVAVVFGLVWWSHCRYRGDFVFVAVVGVVIGYRYRLSVSVIGTVIDIGYRYQLSVPLSYRYIVIGVAIDADIVISYRDC